MRKLIICLAALVCCLGAKAQEKKKIEANYEFTTVKELPVTSIKNQFRSGTCWCFSMLSFLESELLRTSGKEYDLSRMWIVGHSYKDRGVKYVRMDGNIGFSAGSGAGDVLTTIDRYGIVPESVYSGMQYGYDLPVQAELDAVLKSYVSAVLKAQSASRTATLSTAWKRGYDAVIQAYLGEWPSEFEFEGKKYTPEQFRDNVLKFNSSDYINLCSFSDRPLYKMCDIEVCDNWRNAAAYNVTMREMLDIMYNAIDNGYTIAWGGDVSEEGFTRQGIGVMPKPAKDAKPKAGSDQEHWVGKEQAEEKVDTTGIPEEVEVSDSLRLAAYDRKMTTDDHGMRFFGYATDQKGNKYFKVKNSWGVTGKYDGIWYLSETFVAYKTLNFYVHKDALSKDMRKKLGIK